MDIDFDIIPYTHDEKLPWCQIFDLDGTLAIKGDRDIFDFAKVGVDKVNSSIAYLTTLNDDDVIILSGRPDICKNETEEWLYKSDQIYYEQLHMRKYRDYRDDTIIKYELFNEHIRGRYNVRFVVDDRPKVCRMWRKLGLTVLQVGDPHVEF